MTHSHIPISGNTRTSWAAQIGWGVLICATLYVCYFSHLGAIGFVGPDEPRYAWIARDMMETGDWVTPRLYGKPWFEKPPLFYWAAGLCFKWFGVSEASARLPSALSALLATLALAWLARRWYGTETARWLLLLLPSTVGMIGFSHAAATDMPFSAMLTVAMVCGAVVLGLTRNENTPILPRTPWLALILFGFFLGLAVLAKGPVAIILSGGAIFFWALFTKRWRDALHLLHPAAIASFCLTAVPWYILCERRNPDFFRIFIIEHNFNRFLTAEFQHVQPVWFYAPVLLASFLPWTTLLLWSLISGAARLWKTRSIKDSIWFLICWTGFCFFFFSVSQSKLPGYLLPALPAIGLLTAYSCVARAPVNPKSLRVASLLAALFFFVLFGISEISLPHLVLGIWKSGMALAGIVMALLGLANLTFGIFYPKAVQTSPSNFLAALAILPVLLAFSLTDRLVIPYFQWDPSGRTIAHDLQRQSIPTDRLAVSGMNRGMQYSLSFYLHREIKIWDKDHPIEGYLLTGSRRTCRSWAPDLLACEELPFDLQGTGRFLYRVTLSNSPRTTPDGGQPQKKE